MSEFWWDWSTGDGSQRTVREPRTNYTNIVFASVFAASAKDMFLRSSHYSQAWSATDSLYYKDGSDKR